MTTNKRKKNSRQRASHTHGWGSMKKHRGSGHKGGAGMAGTGKRADSKKPSIWKEKYFGRKGFNTHNKKPIIPINVSYIEEHIGKLATQENGNYIIDLSKTEYNKLLGKGKATKKMIITVQSASKKAIDTVKKSGGEVKIQ